MRSLPIIIYLLTLIVQRMQDRFMTYQFHRQTCIIPCERLSFTVNSLRPAKY